MNRLNSLFWDYKEKYENYEIDWIDNTCLVLILPDPSPKAFHRKEKYSRKQNQISCIPITVG